MSNIEPYGRRGTDFYDWRVTLRKMGEAAIVILIALQGASLLTEEKLNIGWKAWATEAIAVGLRGFLDWWRRRDLPSSSMKPPDTLPCHWVAVVLALSLVFAGCVTAMTRFDETITDPDGTQTRTRYGTTATAPPLTKLDTSIFGMAYKWGGKEQNTIEMGQTAEGLDATEWSIIVPILEALIKAMVAAQAGMPAVVAP